VQLENLAREVGVDLSTWVEAPLGQCDGQVAAAFRDLKSVYEKLRSDLLDASGRISDLQTVLMHAPADFQYPPTAHSLDKLHGRPGLIEVALEGARGDEVDRLRSEFDAPARLGNFQPLMSRARDLLDEPRNALTQLLGHVISVENAVAEYRKRLLENPSLVRSQRGLEALTTATGENASKPLGLKDIEAAGPLVEAQKLVGLRLQETAVVGGKVLDGTGVSFDRWCSIVATLDAGRDPVLEAQEADALVKRGLVHRTYRLGVRS
jgi:hypothetical protein